MKSIIAIAIITGSTLLFTSCRKHALMGEGQIISDTRSVPLFTTVRADGSADVEIIQSTENKVIVTGYQNLVPAYETVVKGNTLELEYKEGYRSIMRDNIKVTVYTTDVNRFYRNGSGNAVISENINSDNMSVEINGSGDIRFGTNDFETFTCKINGSGDISARDANSNKVYAEISGSGDIQVSVKSLLNIKISGSGDVNYWGNPESVDTDVSGSGKVKKN